MDDVEQVIWEELTKNEISRAKQELDKVNLMAFDRILSSYEVTEGKNEKVNNVCLENIDTLLSVANTLLENDVKLSDKELAYAYGYKERIDDHFDKYPIYGNSSLTKLLRKCYLSLVNLLKNLEKYGYGYGLYKYPYWYTHYLPYGYQPNERYKRYRKEYQSKIKELIDDGESPTDFIQKEKSELEKESCLDNEVKLLSLNDAEVEALTGKTVDRGDLRVIFGQITHGELMDEKMLDAILHQKRQETEERVKEIKHIEGIKEEQLGSNWLTDKINERLRKDGIEV